jgi:hypothetical protein
MAESCCGAMPRRTVSEYLDRALRRNRAGLHPLRGDECRDGNGLSACFSAEAPGGTIRALGFRVSTCATLLAYCEMLAELTCGKSVTAAKGITAAELVASLPEVPVLKRDRAQLAIGALGSLLQHADQLAIAGEVR